MEALPHITPQELEKARGDAWEFLYVFVRKYFELLQANPEIQQRFTASQHALLAYRSLDSEVLNGGFVQLIHNGYGGCVFDGSFSAILKSWGAEETASIVEKAEAIYIQHKEKLEAETTFEEFSKLYEEVPDFDPLEDAYYTINEADVEKVKQYVEAHIEEFGAIL